MNTAIKTVLLATMLAACGKNGGGNQSLCDGVSTNAVCSETCDPSPAAAVTCPTGYHCSPDGMCDAECNATHACTGGAEYTCDFSTGTCNFNPQPGSGTDTGPDAACPAVHFTATPTTPSVLLVIDRSGSMAEDINGNANGVQPQDEKYELVHQALTGASGVVTSLQASVYFGAKWFTGDSSSAVCPTFDDVPRALNNKQAIDDKFVAIGPDSNTPTAATMTQVIADWVATPPPANSPPIVVLATDGEPNTCGSNNDDTSNTVKAIKNLYNTTVGANTHIPTYVLGVGQNGANPDSLQKFANAGAGVATGQPDATYYQANTPAQLQAAFQTIINGVVSCDLQLNGQVDPTTAQSTGTVVLNGMTLVPGTDWTVDANGTTLHILGGACDTLKSSANPDVDATFGCGSVVILN